MKSAATSPTVEHELVYLERGGASQEQVLTRLRALSLAPTYMSHEIQLVVAEGLLDVVEGVLDDEIGHLVGAAVQDQQRPLQHRLGGGGEQADADGNNQIEDDEPDQHDAFP